MNKSNINIMGEGSSSGGKFGRVKVMGEAVFTGDLKCETFKCTGTSEIEGSLLSNEIKVTGTLQLRSSSGSPEEAVPGVKGETVKVTGELRIPGGCEAEEFKLRGTLETGGMLSAEDIEIKLHGSSRVREMGGSSISVKSTSGIPLAGFFNNGGALVADQIEGDRIYLENTEAKSVRGGHIEIGPGCRIGSIEYRHSLQIDKRSEVGTQLKM
ncbi:hypothetical protein [Paenibacillus caui]|uniref:hypothetical protein n=1 Tax=Paenibacillus caui TaxID=2873927 RepID=UPI001CA9C0BE|nr:hypothetical protein [Paenibacillus caui]